MKRNYCYSVGAFLLLVLIIFTPAFGKDAGDIVVELAAKKIVTGADGREKTESAERAVPGDIIEYAATYKNKGTSGVKNLLGTLPVPQGMEYLPATARPNKISASIDGKTFGTVPLKKKVKMSNGKEEVRDVPYDEYRFLRWDLSSLGAGESVVVSARMRVLSGAAPLRSQDVQIMKQ